MKLLSHLHVLILDPLTDVRFLALGVTATCFTKVGKDSQLLKFNSQLAKVLEDSDQSVRINGLECLVAYVSVMGAD